MRLNRFDGEKSARVKLEGRNLDNAAATGKRRKLLYGLGERIMDRFCADAG